MATLLDALKSAQFVTDAQGQQVAIQIQPAVWQALVSWLEATNGGPLLEEIDPSAVTENLEELYWSNVSMKMSEPSLAQVWDNPEDDVYNDL